MHILEMQNHSPGKLCIPRWSQDQHIDIWTNERVGLLPGDQEIWLHIQVSRTVLLATASWKLGVRTGSKCESYIGQKWNQDDFSQKVSTSLDESTGRLRCSTAKPKQGHPLQRWSSGLFLQVLFKYSFVPISCTCDSSMFRWSFWNPPTPSWRIWAATNNCFARSSNEKVLPEGWTHMHMRKQRERKATIEEQDCWVAVRVGSKLQKGSGSQGAYREWIYQRKSQPLDGRNGPPQGEPRPFDSWWRMPFPEAHSRTQGPQTCISQSSLLPHWWISSTQSQVSKKDPKESRSKTSEECTHQYGRSV